MVLEEDLQGEAESGFCRFEGGKNDGKRRMKAG